VKKHWHKNL